MNYITILEYIGIVAFSMSGASIAIREKFDLFGVFILATVTSVGGGIIRDIVTDIGIPGFFYKYQVIPFIVLGIIFSILFHQQFNGKEHSRQTSLHIIVFKFTGKGLYELGYTAIDAVGLAAFVVSAGLKSLELNYNFMLFLFCSTITGVGGGIFRDILARRKPTVLQSEIYSVAGMAGACSLFILHPYMNTNILASLSIVIIFVIRMASYIYQVNLPVI